MAYERIDQLLNHFVHQLENGPTGCALAVTRHGKVVYERCVGLADVESGREIAPDTLYRIYSSGKVVTATALMILLERGALLLDDPVSRYLPEYRDAVYCHYTGNNMETLLPVPSLTVRHLVTMTSGLTYGGDCNTTQRAVKAAMQELQSRPGGFTTREFARRMAEVPLAFIPGTHWNYGVGHDVLGALIEVVSGKRFGQFLKDEIFDPLGMKDTGFHLEGDMAGRLATLYRYRDGKLEPNRDEDYQFQPGYAYESGGGGMISSLRDYARFGAMLSMGGTLDGVRVIGRKTIDLMRLNHLCPTALEDFRSTHANGWDFMTGFGYGLGVKTLVDQAASGCMGTPGEFSWAGAAGTLLSIDPAEELSITYMHQLMPNNQEGYCHPRVKNVVNGQIL